MGWLMQVLPVRGAQESASGLSCVVQTHDGDGLDGHTAFQGHTTPKFALPGARALN